MMGLGIDNLIFQNREGIGLYLHVFVRDLLTNCSPHKNKPPLFHHLFGKALRDGLPFFAAASADKKQRLSLRQRLK